MTKSTPKLFANITQTVGTTGWPTGLSGDTYIAYAHMNVIAVVNTIAGAGVTVYVQEVFPTTLGPGSLGTVWLTTARFSNLTASGVFYATYDPMGTSNPYASPSNGSNPMLGSGGMKQIVTTAGAVTDFNMDIILCPWNP